MAGVWTWLRWCACVWMLSGCGREAVATATFCDDLEPGDLVVTEVHANPDGSDGEGEYIELFNRTGGLLALDGLVLATSRVDGASPKAHRFVGASIDAERYFVAGNAPVESMPDHVEYSYGKSLGSLRNSDAVVSIRCGDTLIDQVSYESTVDGRALELDGRLAPDHELNDDPGHWCATPEGVDEISAGNFGTPGSSNSPCAVMQMEGTCREGGSERAIHLPSPSEVQLTEWMANPEGPDADLEWVEAFFAAGIDLNGFQLGPAADALEVVIDQEDCFPVDAGTRVVFGASPAAAPRVDAELKFSLGNSDERSVLAAVGDVVLDRVDYDGTVQGVAWQVDPSGEVCLALPQDEYIAQNFGTPGDANPACPPVLGPGMCFDEGTARDIASPRLGDAHIVEWMANPSAVGNREGEWVEVRFDAAADLNGLILSDLTSSTATVESQDCLSVRPGAHVIFGRNANPTENGGLDGIHAELSLSLNNSDETITLSVDGQVLDAVAYERSKAGVATQVDESGRVCDAVHAYGDGDLGTPGSANPWCL
ncbi:MAG: lamin tail domain-containing protein [Myxococcales bacterium]|nr:lamin tail domain-containing protein [Myxococcales bacterium]